MDTAVAGALLSSSHQLVARAGGAAASNGTSSHGGLSIGDKPASYKYIGLALAVGSGLFIGVSFVLKKYGLLKANVKYNEEAGEGYGYLKNFWWWSGMTLMIIGEICNFAAYLFADAILVTPLGALSVVICAILSGIFLKERLSFVGKLGCFNCVVGAIVIAVNAPAQAGVATIQQMQDRVVHPAFLTYGGVVIVGCICVVIWVAPKYGKKSMMVYLTVCSLIGGLSVVCIQGIGAAITAQARGIPQFNYWFTYFIIVFVICTLLVEIIYLNKALNLYNAALVTPTYYVYFTSATIVSDAVLYRGFKGAPTQIVTVVLGFLQICTGVVLLQLSKSAKDVPDTAVFTGDLDQVRTVAEQAEPEYEPRADTMRGTAALLRAVSTKRQQRENKEAARIKEEQMNPIGENEPVEWDGLRRRRTLSSPGTAPIQRRRTVHPPLGMSRFPDLEDEEEDHDNGMHPGFWSHFRRKPSGSTSTRASGQGGSSVAMGPVPNRKGTLSSMEGTSTPPPSSSGSHALGLPPTLKRIDENSLQPAFEDGDTSYQGAGSQHIHWSNSTQDRSKLTTDVASGAPGPALPPHAGGLGSRDPRETTRRQFSFQNMFSRGRSRGDSTGSHDEGEREREKSSGRPFTPLNRSALSFNRKNSAAGGTEEERLGLVIGDSRHSVESPPGYASPDEDLGLQRTTTDLPQYDLNAPTVQRPVRRRNDTGSDSDRSVSPTGGAAKEVEAIRPSGNPPPPPPPAAGAAGNASTDRRAFI